MIRFLVCALVVLPLAASSVRAQHAPSVDRVSAQDGQIIVRPIRHATFVLQYKDLTIYVDPVGGAAAFAGIPKPDLILITDIHGDHANRQTVEAVRKPETIIICPQAVADLFSRRGSGPLPGVRVLNNDESIEVLGVRVTAIPMYNITPSRMRFHPKGRGNGYVVELGGKRIYISGDTEDIQEMRELKNIDLAFVCMNLPFTMTVEQAADAVLQFKPKIVYPYHYRGRGGMSDVAKFKRLVSTDPSIEVRLLRWYP